MKHCLLCEVVMNFWLFFLLRHFHGRSNLPILTANLLRRTGGGVLGVEFALATELSTSVEFINAGVRLVGTVFPPFMTMVISLRPGSLFERSRELFKLPEGEVLPSLLTSILRLHEWRWVWVPILRGEQRFVTPDSSVLITSAGRPAELLLGG